MSEFCPVTGRPWHRHSNAPPAPCPCGYTFTWKPPRGISERERQERRLRDRIEFLADIIVPLLRLS